MHFACQNSWYLNDTLWNIFGYDKTEILNLWSWILQQVFLVVNIYYFQPYTDNIMGIKTGEKERKKHINMR